MSRLLSELRSDRRLRGECPCCGSEIRIAQTELFDLDDMPEKALEMIAARREEIRQRRIELKQRRARITTGAEITSTSVNRGKTLEKIVSSFPAFPYRVSECRSLLEPVDYIVFEGMSGKARLNNITFVEVKSGRGQLNMAQKSIASVVEDGRVEFRLIGRK